MDRADQQVRVEDAFEKIEETILPCLTMMLDSLLDVAQQGGLANADVFAAELQTLACEIEELTRAVEGSHDLRASAAKLRSAA